MISVLLADGCVACLYEEKHKVSAGCNEDIRVVATASNEMEAAARARSQCPDVVVTDVSMPLMDGMEAARQILDHCRFTRC